MYTTDSLVETPRVIQPAIEDAKASSPRHLPIVTSKPSTAVNMHAVAIADMSMTVIPKDFTRGKLLCQSGRYVQQLDHLEHT